MNNDGDGLSLIQPDARIIDEISYEKAPRGESYNRIGNEWLWSKTLTPDSENITKISFSGNEETKNLVEKGAAAITSTAQALKEELSKGEETLRFLPSFLIALSVASLSGIIILFLKKKVKSGHLH